MKKLQYHPLSKVFPMMPRHKIVELSESVKKHGQKLKGTLYKGKILDGRNRYEACLLAGVEFQYREGKFPSDQAALDYVWALNFDRRHLTESQAALAAAKRATLSVGHPRAIPPRGGISTQQAATDAGVGTRTVERARKVLKHGTKKQVQAVESGEKTVAQAEREIEDKAKQREVALDDLGYPIPEGTARVYWDRRDEAQNILKQLRAARTAVKGILDGDPLYAEVNVNGVTSDLGSAINRFKAAVPAYVCTHCQGVTPEKCTVCKGRGVISEFMWSVVPEEIRKMREKAVKNGKA